MNTLGRHFRVTSWGESHGPAIGAVVDGCPAGLPLSEATLQPQLDRRRPGASRLSSARREPDRVRILSGVFEGVTTGAPIALAIDNADADPRDYEALRELYRPSHADFTWEAKFGVRDWRGGGRASARVTAAWVAAGAIAEELLRREARAEVIAWVSDLGALSSRVDDGTVSREDVDATAVRCPDPRVADAMRAAVDAARKARDSLGGCIRCVVRNLPPGLGEPVFGKLSADLAHAMLSIPACRAFEIGEGFAAAAMRGSEHNDPFVFRDGRVRTATQHAGGVQGGISNGESLRFRVAFKPVPTIFLPQETIRRDGTPARLLPKGRHDPCVLPRAVPIVEALVAIVLVDCILAARLNRHSALQLDT